MVTFPTFITLARIALSLFVIPFLFYYGLRPNIFGSNFLIAIIFVLIAITDYFDGYFARKFKLESTLGKILDPMADKFLLCSCLVSLVAVERFNFYLAILFLAREFFVTTLRQIALEYGFKIHVSTVGKLKTFFQFLMIFFVILNPFHFSSYFNLFNIIELLLIIIAFGLSILSGFYYFAIFWIESKLINLK